MIRACGLNLSAWPVAYRVKRFQASWRTEFRLMNRSIPLRTCVYQRKIGSLCCFCWGHSVRIQWSCIRFFVFFSVVITKWVTCFHTISQIKTNRCCCYCKGRRSWSLTELSVPTLVPLFSNSGFICNSVKVYLFFFFFLFFISSQALSSLIISVRCTLSTCSALIPPLQSL